MRFLMLNWRDPHNPLAGGAERVTLGYLSCLVRRGHEAFWFAPRFPQADPQSIIEGVTILREGGIGSSIPMARRWVNRMPRFDLVIDQHHGIPWYAPWWCKTHCLAYIHEVLGPIWNTFYGWPYSVIGRWQERWTHWFYRRVPFWTASSATKAGLHAAGVRDVTLIPYGVHTVALPELNPKPIEQPLRLASVSRLAPNKRVDHAILTLERLLAMGLRAHLTVVGSGMAGKQLQDLAAAKGLADKVEFAGPLPEPGKDAILKKAHLLLHTSVREGWGLNVIEANALGTPAVVYPVAGLVESTLHEQTGLVSAAETPEALAQSVARLVRNPDEYQRYRRQAWDRAKTFHWDRILPRAADWLEGQARGRPAAGL